MQPPVVVAALLLLLFGAAALGWITLRDGRATTGAAVVIFIPIVLLVAAVLVGSGDRSQIGITTWVFTLLGAMLPAWYVLHSGPDTWFMQWRFMLVCFAFVSLILPAFLVWLAGWTAWVPPAPGTLPMAEHRLKHRVQSLDRAGLSLTIEPIAGRSDRLIVTREFRDGKRSIGVRLTFLSDRHCVLAREVSLIRGDKPMNASEAQLRSGPRQRNGVHPDATTIYDASLTVTLPSEAIRRQIQLRIAADRVEISAGHDVAAEPKNLSHVLTELVRQSGWAWQGVFANWQIGCGRS